MTTKTTGCVAAIQALYQMDDADSPTPPDVDDNDEAAIDALSKVDEEESPPCWVALSLHNATAIARLTEIVKNSAQALRKNINGVSIGIQVHGSLHIVDYALHGTKYDGI
ncbi:hypothetical protein EYR38_010005 [Pleurotus pulmonarius]|nr:hypothetical protein EYR38_010005 [Pleurotus pulmonarius]